MRGDVVLDLVEDRTRQASILADLEREVFGGGREAIRAAEDLSWLGHVPVLARCATSAPDDGAVGACLVGLERAGGEEGLRSPRARSLNHNAEELPARAERRDLMRAADAAP